MIYLLTNIKYLVFNETPRVISTPLPFNPNGVTLGHEHHDRFDR